MKQYTMNELKKMQSELLRNCTEENKGLTILSLKVIQKEINKLIEKGFKYL